jgi:CTP synthase
VKIALVGKYTKLEDSYISVIKALKHAALSCRLRLKLDCIGAENLEEECLKSTPVKYHEAWKTVCAADGIIVPGGFGNRGIEGKILAAKHARERNVPYLGKCVCMSIFETFIIT